MFSDIMRMRETQDKHPEYHRFEEIFSQNFDFGKLRRELQKHILDLSTEITRLYHNDNRNWHGPEFLKVSKKLINLFHFMNSSE